MKRKDSHSLIDIIKKQTGLEPKMWGPSIVGFGGYHYKYDSGHEGDSPLVGFSPRVSAITLYFSGDFEERHHLRPSGAEMQHRKVRRRFCAFVIPLPRLCPGGVFTNLHLVT